MKKGNSKEGTLWSSSAGDLQAVLTKLAIALGGEGASVIRKLRDDEAYLRRAARFLKRGGLSEYVHAREVKALLEDNCFGIDDWLSLQSDALDKNEINQVTEFPWTIETLLSDCPFHPGRKVRDTHFAFLVRPLNLVQWARFSEEHG